jgi:PAS domain S-box-containing protein
MFSFFCDLFDTSGFPPRWHCGQWTDAHGWLHIVSDIAIFGAYAAIPLVLVFFIRKRKDVPFSPIFWLFSAFIVSCGLTHLIEATIFWHPWYRLSGLLKAVTAVVSWVTVMALIRVIPSALALPGLAEVNQQLSEENAERKHAQETLPESEERFRAIADNLPQLAWLADGEGRVSWFNKRWLDYTGTTLEDNKGAGWKAVHHPDYVEAVAQNFERHLSEGKDWEDTFPLRGKDGKYRWFLSQMKVIRNEAGSVVRFFGTNTDITAMRQMEEALRESEARFRVAVEAVSSIIWTNDADGMMHGEQPGWGNFTGQTQAEYQGHGWAKAVQPDDAAPTLAAWERAVAEKRLFEFEHRLRRADGEWRLCSIRAVPLVGSDGVIREWVGVHTDITERKRAVQALCELNETLEERVRQRTVELVAANKELEAFSYSVAHDLRAPLRGIDGFSKALLQDYGPKLDAEGQDYLRFVREGCQRMGLLIDDLLKLSRTTRAPLRREPVDLTEMAWRIARDLRRLAPERAVDLLIAEHLTTMGDPTLLEAALRNLLENAWKFTGQRAEALVEFGALEQPGGVPAFFVRDNGAGFDMRYADKLFGVFQRLHRPEEFAGTGIGLATVQRIFQRHSGRIWAEAEVDKGATFYFTLNEKEPIP